VHGNIKRIVDGSLILALCAAPYFLGGRYAVGRLAFVALAAVAAIGYGLHLARQRTASWRHTAAQWLFVAAFLVVLMQLVPLPQSLIERAHPTLSQHLPLWTAKSQSTSFIGTWDRISLYPHATTTGLAMLAAYAAFFLIAVQRLDSATSIERLVRWIAVGAVIMAGVGLVQYLAGNGKFLWVYDHPFRNASRSATGGFDNNNHFAHYLALGVGPLLWWLVTVIRSSGFARSAWSWESSKRKAGLHPVFQTPYVPLVGLGVLMFAVLMSSSRGGALVATVATSIAGLILFRSGHIQGKVAALLASVAVVAAVAVGMHGLDVVSQNLDDLTAGSVEQLDQEGARRAIWSANLSAFSENVALGTGVGTHQYLIPIYLDRHFPTEFSHAESAYLQVLTETGVAGGVILVVALGLCGWWCFKALRFAPSSRHLALAAAVVSSLVVSVVHSIWDFPWYIPGLMCVTLLLAACVCRLAKLATSEEGNVGTAGQSTQTRRTIPRSHGPTVARSFPGLRWAGLTCATLLGAWAVSTCLPPALASPGWDSYLRRSVALQSELGSFNVETEIPPEEQHAHDVERIDAMIADLQHAISRNPSNARFHLRLAAKLLVRYDLALADAPNEMPVNQLRDAAAAAGFADLSALHAWVERAVGKDAKSYLDRAIDHIHRAHRQTPLEPEGYLHLADLAFLESSSKDSSTAYFEQARRVDPHDGDVLIRAGADALLQWDIETATRHWRSAFAMGPAYQRKLALYLAGRVPVGLFIEEFKPDLELLTLLEHRFSQLDLPQELETLRRHAAARAVAAAREAEQHAQAEAGGHWLKAVDWFRKVKEHRAAAACGRRAVAFCPQDFQTRRAAGLALSEAGDFAEAEKHLQWCIDHKPDDPQLQQEFRRAMAGRMRSASAADAGVRVTP
jgi:O-antigen ligase/tetratricopeptide (TPR) repeat protein